MGRVVEFDGHSGAKQRIADNEIDVLGANAIEVCLPVFVAIIRIDDIRQSHLREDDMITRNVS